MKRFVAIWLLIAYTASAIDFSFSFHYCGGRFHGICFTADTEADCCGEKEMDNGCCEDKVVSAKIKDHHTSVAKTVITTLAAAFTPAILPAVFRFASAVGSNYVRPAEPGPSPPVPRSIPLYLFIGVLRI